MRRTKLRLYSKRKQLFQNENNLNNEKPRKTLADVMRLFNGISDFETGEEVLEDFRKHQGEEIYIK